MSTVERQRDTPEEAPPGTSEQTSLDLTDTAQNLGKTKQGGSGASFTEKQKQASVLNLQKAAAGKLLKKDLEKKVVELEEQLEKATLEAQRQKEKKRREKQRANTLAELAAQQKKQTQAPAPQPEEGPKQASFDNTERPQPVQDPRKNPRVRAFMAQGADLKMAMRMAGVN